MKVALTGASGFIGRHVLNELIQQDVEIVAITRDIAKLDYLKDSVQVLELDIYADTACYKNIGFPDVLIHLAWDGLPNYKSLHHFETELPRQYKFIKQLVESGLSSLFVSGTCFEYGMHSGALSENIKTNPSNPYGYAKDALRRQLEFLKEVTPFNLVWGRLFYMYGEGQANNSLYSQLKHAVLSGDKVFNMSGGEQLRDYLPVESVAKRIVKLALLQKNIGCVNVCSGKPVSVRNLVEQWLRENDWEIELNFGYYPYPNYEPMEFWGTLSDISN